MRQLKVLVVLLVLSNIAVGAFSYYLLRSLDRQYSELVDRTVPIINDLQTLTAEAAQAMRATDPSLFGGSASDRAAALAKAHTALERVRALDARIRTEPSVLPADENRAQFIQAGDAFAARVGELIKTYEKGGIDAAATTREASLRPTFERYLQTTTKFADDLEAEGHRLNDSFTAKTSNLSNTVLSIASWPLLLLAGLLLLTAIFVLIIMLLFRRREINDAT